LAPRELYKIYGISSWTPTTFIKSYLRLLLIVARHLKGQHSHQTSSSHPENHVKASIVYTFAKAILWFGPHLRKRTCEDEVYLHFETQIGECDMFWRF